MESLTNRIQMLNQHFDYVPYNNCYYFYKICVILAYCKDIQILNLGNEINYKGKTYLVYNLVMYIYYRKITKSKMPSLFEPIWIELKFSNLL